MKKASAYSISLLAALLVGCSGQPPSLSWEYVETGIQASLRGLSVVDSQSVWISGSGGSVAHTQDGGSSWSVEIVPGAEALDSPEALDSLMEASIAALLAGDPYFARLTRLPADIQQRERQFTRQSLQGMFDYLARVAAVD